jgi:hypothetical protein
VKIKRGNSNRMDRIYRIKTNKKHPDYPIHPV